MPSKALGLLSASISAWDRALLSLPPAEARSEAEQKLARQFEAGRRAAVASEREYERDARSRPFVHIPAAGDLPWQVAARLLEDPDGLRAHPEQDTCVYLIHAAHQVRCAFRMLAVPADAHTALPGGRR
jgi:hypothetical protein